jgi:eukaryotic-like serine/threonine-protein kinase
MEAAENIGKVLGGSYHLVRLIGEGGMGAVYEAEHIRLPRRFAVKLLRAEVGADPVAIERFRREADIASSIGHEHIVDVVDFNVTGAGVPYMVLELLEGEDLGTRIKRNGHLTPAELRPILDQVAEALDAAHSRGVIHRDLKPQNLFLCKRGGRDDFIKILDFGISKIVHSPSVVTQAGTVFGTPNYMSPEQAQGPGVDLDPRTDVFTLGVVCYEALTGQLAFDGSSAAATLYKVCHTDPIPPHSLVADLPPAVEAVVMRAMAKAVEDRWQSARQVAAAFTAAVEGKPLPAEIPSDGILHVRPAVPDTGAQPTTTSPITQPARTRAPVGKRILGGAALACALAGGYWLYAGFASNVIQRQPIRLAEPSGVPQPRDVPPASPVSPAPPAVAARPSASAHAAVGVRLLNLPQGARVQVDGVVVPDNPLKLAYGPIAREIRVTSDACAPFVRQLVPLDDAELVVPCEPPPAPRPRSKSRAAVDAKPAPPPPAPPPPEKKELIEKDL